MSESAITKGQSATEILCALRSQHPSIRAFRFALLDLAPPLERRALLGSDDHSVASRARNLRDTLSLPFWDGVMLTAANSESFAGGLLNAATFHQSLAGKTRRIESASISAGYLAELASTAQSEGRLLAFVSQVEMNDGANRHFPLLDFHAAFSNHSTMLVKRVIEALRLHGTLLKSGKSYHFYGNELLTPEHLGELLAKALLFGPIIDRTWIAHQLIEGRCALRVSARPEYGGPPTVIATL